MTTISFFDRLMDLVAPRACAVCGRRMGIDETALGAQCNMELPRTDYAANPYDNEMARLFWAKMAVERCAALFFYQPGSPSGRMIHKLKYHDRPDIGREMGRMAAAEFATADFFEGIDMIVPVPLEKTREHKRGYNQSNEIAEGVADMTRIDVRTDIIKRQRATESQTRLSHNERTDNVTGAFSLTNAYAAKDKHILIVDDIVTSGSTVCACGRELMKAGGVRMSVLSLGFTKS